MATHDWRTRRFCHGPATRQGVVGGVCGFKWRGDVRRFCRAWTASFDGCGTGGSFCEDTCEFAADGECDEDRLNPEFLLCASGTDCFDCEPLLFSAKKQPETTIDTGAHQPVPSKRQQTTSPVHRRVDWRAR